MTKLVEASTGHLLQEGEEDPHASLRSQIKASEASANRLRNHNLRDEPRSLGREIIELWGEIQADRDVSRAKRALRRAEKAHKR